MRIIGIAESEILTDHLYRRGKFALTSTPMGSSVDAALMDAAIAPGPDVALIVLGNNAAPENWPGSVRHVTTESNAISAGLQALQAGARAAVITAAGIGTLVIAHEGTRVYASIEVIADTATVALEHVDARAIGYLELVNPDDPAELNTIMPAYQTADPALTCAIDRTGGLGALITAALAVYHRFIPAVPDWEGPTDPALWDASPFYAITHPKTWFLEEGQTLRRAAINWPGTHLIVSEHPAAQPRPNGYLRHSTPQLFIVTAANVDALAAQLRAVDEAVRHGAMLPDLAADLAVAYSAQPGAATVALLGRDRDDLLREIDAALQGIPRGETWHTPRGSYYTPAPLGQTGKVAFVYPGAFNSYPRMAQDILFMCPAAHDATSARVSQLGEALGEQWLYTRSIEKVTKHQWKQIRKHLEERTPTMIEAGITCSMIFTQVMREVFDIQPEIAFGYSVGEASMLYALDVWRDVTEGHATLHASPIYHDRLSGPKNAAREMWGFSADLPDSFWGVFFIGAPVKDVEAAVQTEPHVFLTHINTPAEVVIAGEAEACKRVVDRLNANAMRAAFDMIIHNDVTFLEYDRFHELHDHPVYKPPQDVAFYSAADYATVPLEQGVLAHSLSRMTCKTLDFPRLVERVYADGARIFIELGPRSTCARWISESLGDQPHLSVSINHLGVDDHTALMKMLAQLVAHGVPLNLSALYETYPVSQPAHLRSLAAGDMPYDAVTQAHKTFLDMRLDGLRMLGDLLALQTESATAVVEPQSPAATWVTPAPVSAPVPVAQYQRSPAIFDEQALEEFAIGSIKACFGPEYAVYDARRAPRIPNGDLLLVSRIVAVDAIRHELKPGASVTSEYDIPVQPWFYQDNAYPTVPYAIYMEMALQLCGLLSAYLGSSLKFPDLDFYFRNLDGKATLHFDPDLRGKTITNRVTLLSSITLEGIILQNFSFALELDGDVFFEGESSFGFFTAQAMRGQTGLDKGQSSQPWYIAHNIPAAPGAIPQQYYRAAPGKLHYRLSTNQLDLIDTLVCIPDSGKYEQGYIYASNQVDPADWFFDCHFFEDPVMPGSLGVEAILQAMQAFALEQGLGAEFANPHFEQATGNITVWRYRGQVTRDNTQIAMEIHVKRIERTTDAVTIVGDASLWRNDGLRIYEVLDIALRVRNTV